VSIHSPSPLLSRVCLSHLASTGDSRIHRAHFWIRAGLEGRRRNASARLKQGEGEAQNPIKGRFRMQRRATAGCFTTRFMRGSPASCPAPTPPRRGPSSPCSTSPRSPPTSTNGSASSSLRAPKASARPMLPVGTSSPKDPTTSPSE